MDHQNTFNIIKNFFTSRDDIKIVLVYGSFAAATENSKSDIDLAISAGGILAPNLKVEIITELSLLTKREIDLIDLQTANGTVFKEAMTKGLRVKNTDTILYSQILKKMLFDEEDFQKTKRKLNKSRRNKIFYDK